VIEEIVVTVVIVASAVPPRSRVSTPVRAQPRPRVVTATKASSNSSSNSKPTLGFRSSTPCPPR
jgi:hypothetical protein